MFTPPPNLLAALPSSFLNRSQIPVYPKMASQNDNTNQRTSSFDLASPPPAVSSCRRKKNFGSGSFVSDLRDHVHEFFHASPNEHRTCLKHTIQKLFKTSKAVGENSKGRIEGETSVPLQTTMSD